MNHYQRTCLKHARALRKRADKAGNDNLTVLYGSLNEIAHDLEQAARHDSPTWNAALSNLTPATNKQG